MNRLRSEVVFNRVLMWLVMANLADDKVLCALFILCAILNLFESLLTYMEGE